MSIAPQLYALSPRQSLSSELASILAKKIDSGEYAPGESLPSEQALAETFSVSRTVVREALTRLKEQDKIRPRRGLPALVTASHEHAPGHNFEFEEVTVDNYVAFNSFRLIVEGESAALAAINATAEEAQIFMKLANDLERELLAGKAGLEPDFQFHCLLGTVNGNEYLRDLVKAIAIKIWRGVHQGRSRNVADEAYVKNVCGEHRAIAEAIMARDAHRARIAARMHLLNSALRQGLPIDAKLLIFS